ncbi:MAG: bifunctional glutamate N-acetyltransferase/amino-acid acetyltransferase ArgJ, partial [Terrimicrobiaceae bacterium]
MPSKTRSKDAQTSPPWSIKIIEGGVLAPKGFQGGAVAAGIKNPKVERLDLALVVSDSESSAAGTFTTNKVKAAPVLVSMEHIKTGKARAVVLNSGNANACTGLEGLKAAKGMAAAAAKKIGAKPGEVLVCSTGRIGVAMPGARIAKGLAALELSRAEPKNIALAIMTSDTFPKHIALQVKTQEGVFHVGAIAKGAGMIDPTMATMLCVITTDAVVAPPLLRKVLRQVVEDSFNRITVDGDMSTNDTVIVLASGASGVKPEEAVLAAALQQVAEVLARSIVLDGEGVGKFVEVEVIGAASKKDAKVAAEAVANSTLVKCAWAGNDPNWGRMMDTLGYCGAMLDESKIAMAYDGLPIVE